MNHTTLRLAIIIIAATLMISGTIFYPMVRKQQAYSATSATHQVKSQEEQAVRSSLEQRNQKQQQHMDQGNLCIRAGKCSNSNIGEQILGNDNSVTGFTDQSKNVQATVTPTPTPTPTATPIPTPCQEDEPSTAEEVGPGSEGPLGVQVCPPGEDEPSPNEETSGDQS